MSRAINLWIGDSITEGYGDGMAVSAYGFVGRLQVKQWSLLSGAQEQHLNLGSSGKMVDEYLRIGRGFISADPTGITAAFVSIWSPNVPGGDGSWAYDGANLAAMRIRLEAFAAWCVAQSVLFVPIFIENPPYDAAAWRRSAIAAHIAACAATWPFLLNLQPATQDPEILDGPQMKYVYDVLHPSPTQHQAIADYLLEDVGGGVARWAAARLAAAQFYGFEFGA